MTIEETLIAEKQTALLKHRRAMIEQGKLESCQPIPDAILPRADVCPNCGERMKWLKSRQGWICFKESCQPALRRSEPPGPPAEQAHFANQLEQIRTCAEMERTKL